MKLPAILLGIAMMIAGVCARAAPAADDAILAKAREIEGRLGARVGLVIQDTGDGRSWRYRADERFPMMSTFKALACGALLHRADEGGGDLEKTVLVAQADLVPYAPVSKAWVGRRVALGDLCAATMRTSDNVAANKILESIGGPGAVTAFARGLGDRTTRLDRYEPGLNEGTPGDARDTTSPAAMADTLRALVLGDVLSASSKARLTGWLVGNEVGGPLLRAGIPRAWRTGDRTGAGGHGSRGVIAVMWPPAHAPIVAAIYITGTDASMEDRNAAIAGLGAALAAEISR